MELLIDHVSKRFKDKKAVSNVSLALTPGVWGLLGANGAGKTTLMRIIAGIMQPTSGQVVYDGVPIQTLGEQYRAVFGYLPQEFGFHQEFTVKDYLAYVAALKGLPERQSWRKIHELLERVSLLDVCNKKISKLSGGMRRRVGIAQALLNDPEVLILDEPTGGLDPGERVRFRNLLPLLIIAVKISKLFKQHRRLHAVEPGICTDHIIIILAGVIQAVAALRKLREFRQRLARKPLVSRCTRPPGRMCLYRAARLRDRVIIRRDHSPVAERAEIFRRIEGKTSGRP